jgi:hypothetical protein
MEELNELEPEQVAIEEFKEISIFSEKNVSSEEISLEGLLKSCLVNSGKKESINFQKIINDLEKIINYPQSLLSLTKDQMIKQKNVLTKFISEIKPDTYQMLGINPTNVQAFSIVDRSAGSESEISPEKPNKDKQKEILV